MTEQQQAKQRLQVKKAWRRKHPILWAIQKFLKQI